MRVKLWQSVCEMYVTSYIRPFVPSVGILDYYALHRAKAQSVF